MTPEEVQKLVINKALPQSTRELQLIETHISWVLLADTFVYKLKKPVKLSFLDFSTVEKRKYSCEQEVLLNRRLAPDMYLGVVPVTSDEGKLQVGGHGEVIDHAVWMKRMDESRQMDLQVQSGEVTARNMKPLAEVVARFHGEARTVRVSETWKELHAEFADIEGQKEFLDAHYQEETGLLLEEVSGWIFKFLKGVKDRIEERKVKGFVIDGHGDLHCRNIFMLDPPVIFDCIEFSAELRTLDVLNEVAFLCMDLERFGREDLAEAFLSHYLSISGAIENQTDRLLFLYYKLYRANVRIKVHCIGIKDGLGPGGNQKKEYELLEAYFRLFRRYFQELKRAEAAWE